MNLTKYSKETFERYYNRYEKAIKNLLEKTSDRDFTLTNLHDYFCNKFADFKYEHNKLIDLFDELDNLFKINRHLAIVLKSYRKEMSQLNSSKLNTNKSGRTIFPIENYTDIELVRLFAEYKTYDELVFILENNNWDVYRNKIKKQKQALHKEITEEIETNFTDQKSSDFTTSRQILALHYMFKYMQVKNVDKTETARFFQFITGKSFDNIYKRVRDPLRENNKTLKSDLKYIREYFNKLEMLEIVKMINNEIAQCDAKK
jgi:hypothetical protein